MTSLTCGVYKTERDPQTWRMHLWLAGRGMGRRDSWGVQDGHVHRMYLKGITNRDPLHSTGNSAQCYAWLGREGSLGENGYMAESLCCSSEIVTTLFVNQTYTQIQNKKYIF